MTLTASPYDNQPVSSESSQQHPTPQQDQLQQPQQRRSAQHRQQRRRQHWKSRQSLRQLRQSLLLIPNLQHMQQQEEQQNQQLQETSERSQSPASVEDGSLIPGDNADTANCLRFYKGLAAGNTTTSTSAAVAAAAASFSVIRRSAARRGRRFRASAVACVHNRMAPFIEADAQLSDNNKEAVTTDAKLPMPTAEAAASAQQAAGGVKTTTQDTRSTSSSSHEPDDDLIDNSKLRQQLIFYKGRLQVVEVMKWPEKNRIPTTERYRLEEPMRSHYGKRSVLTRLLKALEQSKCLAESVDRSAIRGPIPLLPKHMLDFTKNRLLLWYKPLENSGEFHAPQEAI